VLRRYRKVLVPELNTGQLRLLLRATYLVDVVGLNKVQGRPFLVDEISQRIEELLLGENPKSEIRNPKQIQNPKSE
jgi:2-oxoglutarate/2-oxoacid ferredoxin oxidoreductase subunit alpha